MTGSLCVFPFQYKGVTYSSCTKTDSQAAWCATETETSGEVKTGMWEDCQANCPSEEESERGKISETSLSLSL